MTGPEFRRRQGLSFFSFQLSTPNQITEVEIIESFRFAWTRTRRINYEGKFALKRTLDVQSQSPRIRINAHVVLMRTTRRVLVQSTQIENSLISTSLNQTMDLYGP